MFPDITRSISETPYLAIRRETDVTVNIMQYPVENSSSIGGGWVVNVVA